MKLEHFALAHAPRHFVPILNGGELAIMFCFAFLYIAIAGPRRLERGRTVAPRKAGKGRLLSVPRGRRQPRRLRSTRQAPPARRIRWHKASASARVSAPTRT